MVDDDESVHASRARRMRNRPCMDEAWNPREKSIYDSTQRSVREMQEWCSSIAVSSRNE